MRRDWLFSLYYLHELPRLSSKVFAWYYMMVKSPNDPGFYTFRIRRGASGITGLATNCGPWKYKWFRVKGSGIPVTMAKPFDVLRPTLSDEEYGYTRRIKKLSDAERHVRVVCSIKNLKRCGLIPKDGDFTCVYDEGGWVY